jgi:hypothetical protein
MTHFERCKTRVRKRAPELRDKVESDSLNPFAIEGILRQFVKSDAFRPEWRSELLRIGMMAADQ